MEFPTMVYRCPGLHQRPGGTFDYRAVADEEAFLAALADGWHATMPDAINPPKIRTPMALYSSTAEIAPPEPEPDQEPEMEQPLVPDLELLPPDESLHEPDSDPAPVKAAPETTDEVSAPPTRNELKRKAELLGIKYPRNASYDTLADMIASATKE